MQIYELSVIAFTCLANWLDIFYVPFKKHVYLRAAVGKYREFAVNTEISKYFIFCQEKPFGETFSKITIKASKEFSFSRKPAKVKCCPTPYSRRSKTFELYYFQSPWEERRLKETSSSLAGK